MYPYKVYISKPGERYKLYPVWIRGYTQAISVGAFNNRILKEGYKASKEFKSFDVYNCLSNLERRFEIDSMVESNAAYEKKYGITLDPAYDIQEREYELFDFYDDIKYDRKTGKIASRTLRQHIIHYMKERP